MNLRRFLHLFLHSPLLNKRYTKFFPQIFREALVELIFMPDNSQPLVEVFFHQLFFPFESVFGGIVQVRVTIVFRYQLLMADAVAVCGAETTFLMTDWKLRHGLLDSLARLIAETLFTVHEILHDEGQFGQACSLEEFEGSFCLLQIINFLFFLKLQ